MVTHSFMSHSTTQFLLLQDCIFIYSFFNLFHLSKYTNASPNSYSIKLNGTYIHILSFDGIVTLT